jgi:nitrogen fixation-related uncharacterized protein
MASTIGIKIANGDFYSIIEENSSVKKRLILTTVHDKQRSVQIDLYKSFTKTMADALYIGSLVVENIVPKPKGEPSIELVISSNKEGEIVADAIDLDTRSSGEHHYLNVSLKSLDEDNRDGEIPDFELEQNEEPPSGLYGKAKAAKEGKTRSFPWLLLVIIGVIIIAAILALWFFFLRGKSGAPDRPRPAAESVLPAESEVMAPADQAKSGETVRPAEKPPVVQAPSTQPKPAAAVKRDRPPAPVSSYKVPALIPPEGASYRIRWGDTLWDISEAFYRDPWLYPRIARFNNIGNPDLIISGTTIRVPPKN